MENVTEHLKDISQSYGDVAKMISSVIVGGVALVGVAKTTLIPYFAASGPAIEFHEMKVVASFPGQPSYVNIKLSKLRPCKPSVISLELTDSGGRTFPVDIAWTRPLTVRKHQTVTFDWTMPKNIRGGSTTAYLSATHANCDDGGRSPPPQDITTRTHIFVE
jgi:hypothetical protein